MLKYMIKFSYGDTMNIFDKFFLFTLLTIIITRISVYIFNKPSPTINGFRTHHWMYGLLFTIIFLAISRIYTNIYLLAISLGIFLDEIGFIIIRGKNHEDNYSPKSFMIILIFILILFIIREPLINFYLSI